MAVSRNNIRLPKLLRNWTIQRASDWLKEKEEDFIGFVHSEEKRVGGGHGNEILLA